MWLRGAIYVLLLTPLVYSGSLLFPFFSSKAYFLFAAVEIALVFALWAMTRARLGVMRFHLLDLCLVLLVGVFTLASLAGVDLSWSFWSELDRMTGLLLWFHLLAVYGLFACWFSSEKSWVTVWLVASLVAIVVSLVFLLGLMGIGLISSTNSGSTLGNSTFLGTYLLFAIVFSYLLASQATTQFGRTLGWVALGMTALTLLLTDAYTAIAVFVGGLVLFYALRLLGRPSRLAKRWGASILIILVCVSATVAFSVFQEGSIVQQKLIGVSTGSRFVVWQIAFEAIKERPLLGWGLENFQSAFLTHYNPCLGSDYCGASLWFDRAHNKLLDLLVETGVIGLLAYLGVFVGSFWSLWRFRTSQAMGSGAFAALATLLAMYFVQSLMAFDTVTSLLFLVIALSYIRFVTRETSVQEEVHVRKPVLMYVGAILGTALLPLALYVFVWQPVRANVATHTATTIVDPDVYLDDYRVGTSVSPMGLYLRRIYLADYTITRLWYGDPSDVLASSKFIEEEIAIAKAALEQTIAQKSDYLRAYLHLGQLLQVRERFFPGTNFLDAETVLREAIARFPLQPQAYWSLASVYLEAGRVTEAIALTRQVVERSPESEEAAVLHLLAVRFLDDEVSYASESEAVIRVFSQARADVDTVANADLLASRLQLLFFFH